MLLTQTHFPLSGKENHTQLIVMLLAAAFLYAMYKANHNAAQAANINSKAIK